MPRTGPQSLLMPDKHTTAALHSEPPMSSCCPRIPPRRHALIIMSLSSVLGYDSCGLFPVTTVVLRDAGCLATTLCLMVSPCLSRGFGVLGRKSARVKLRSYPISRQTPSTQHVQRLFAIHSEMSIHPHSCVFFITYIYDYVGL